MPTVPIHRLSVNTWHYQLQDVDPAAIADLDVDLVVIDAAKPDGRDRVWSSDEIKRMKGDGKKVIAYLSIGEAEDYRAYWKPEWVKRNWLGMSRRPAWLDAENPDWKGNFKVKYWHAEWQKIILKRVEEIVTAGFDGLYLDIIDAYEYYQDNVFASDAKMIDFVVAIAQHARAYAATGKFAIIPQNGEGLLTSPLYREHISAIGKEDVFFGQRDGDGMLNYNGTIEGTLSILERHATANMIQTLFVEYADDYASKDDEVLQDQFGPAINSRMPRSMWRCPIIIADRDLDQTTYELTL